MDNPSLADEILQPAAVTDLSHVFDAAAPPATASWPPAKPAFDLVKRVIDVLIALTVLLLFSPLWLAIAAAIRLSSKGPVLFSGTVVGKGCRPFTYLKFRSMVAGDDSRHREWIERFVVQDAPYAAGRYKVLDDPRVTRVGRLLRRLSLDEVPQLVNVLKGEMSVIGPRPPLVFEYGLYDESAKRRLAIRPGITGLYQVTARSTVPFSKMVELDCEYIRDRSLWLDVKILARTAIVMSTGRGAG
jgi:lipopolysaccharide/colanic/teichoic acid biosynthesis glycosyltransferase